MQLPPSLVQQDPSRVPGRFVLNWHQDRELHDDQHFMIENIGGYGSGKSQVIVLVMRERSKWDTGQRGGLFANTITQINEGILPDVFEWLEKLGIEYVFGGKPPAQWVRMWQKLKIPYPQRGPRSPHTLILKSGLHVVCGGLANRAFKRYKGFKFGWICIEEVTELESPEPIGFLLPRCRCGDFGSGLCLARHRHQMYLHGNPPDPRQPHWIRDWTKRMCQEERARRAVGEPPFFMYLRSSTYDNVQNVGYDYVRRLKQGLDPETAEAMIDGSLTQVSSNTTYSRWDRSRNVLKMEYDPTRPIHVSMDFNVMPAASILGHELFEEEVPDKFRGSDGTYVGTWGEFANFSNMTAVQHAYALLNGDRDRGGHWPKEFKGLRNHQGHIFMYGDSTGHMRRAESEGLRSAWEQVNDVLMPILGRRYHFDVPKANPTQYDSITLLNAKMQNDAGEVTYFVAPWCTELIADYEQTVPKEDGSEWIDKRKDKMRTHWQDPERYRVWVRYPGSRRNNLRDFKRVLSQSTFSSPLVSLGELPPPLAGPK
jgi:hypothetical protein